MFPPRINFILNALRIRVGQAIPKGESHGHLPRAHERSQRAQLFLCPISAQHEQDRLSGFQGLQRVADRDCIRTRDDPRRVHPTPRTIVVPLAAQCRPGKGGRFSELSRQRRKQTALAHALHSEHDDR